MAEVYLNKRELKKILELVESTYPDEEFGSVKVSSVNESGIGSVVTATVNVQINGYDGEFTTVISDERDW